ncbi:cohesin domain-containing protein, partial [Candidatus Poribacteria bacterium]
AVFFLLFCVSAYGVQVSVPEVTTESGSTITVEISVDDATGLASADVKLGYDPAILAVIEARKTALTIAFLMASNLDVPGEVSFAMAGFPGIPEGSGAILEVDFEVIAAGPSSSPLTLSDVAMFNELGEAIDITIVNGSVKVKGEEVTASGKLTVLEIIPDPIGTHGLFDNGTLLYALESSTLALDEFVDKDVTVQGILTQLGVDGGPDLLDVFSVDVEEPPGPPVVREHESGSLILALESAFDEANVHGHTYIDIWAGEMVIEAGMFLEFQVAMFSGNPTFSGSVDLHTSDGGNLRDSGTADQNSVNSHPGSDLSAFARDQWYHRKISLDALVGKTVDGAMIAVDSNEHLAGVFRVYADNIQITDGEYVLMSIYADEDTVPITGNNTATGTTFAGVQGMSGFSASVVGVTPVEPTGKLISSWGSIKSMR